MAIVTEGIK